MPDIAITITLTQEQHDAVVAGLPKAKDDKRTDDERLAEYMQAQSDTICAQFVATAKAKALEADGLPSTLAQVGLDDDDIAAIKAARAAKVEARVG